jgi:hypothetical protein
MTDRSAARTSLLALVLAGIAYVGVATGTVFAFPAATEAGFTGLYSTDLVLAASFATIGVLVAKRSDNPIGWLFLAIAVGEAITVAMNHYAIVGLSAEPVLPGSVWAAWLGYWLVSFIVPSGLFLLLLIVFPNGRPVSKRWAWLARVGLAFSVLFALSEILLLPRMELATGITFDNPTNVASSTAPETAWVLGMAFLIGGVAALVVRYRRSRGEERQQLRWFVFAVAASIGSLVVMTLSTSRSAHRTVSRRGSSWRRTR